MSTILKQIQVIRTGRHTYGDMESSSLREKIKVQLIRHFMNTQAIRIFGVGWQKLNEHKIQLRFEILHCLHQFHVQCTFINQKQ